MPMGAPQPEGRPDVGASAADGPAALNASADATGAGPVDPRIALLVADIARRLQRACRDWDDAEFEALVHRIAQIKVRWAEAKS